MTLGAATELEQRLRERIQEVNERIAASAARSGRTANDVTLIGVSKTVGRDAVDAAYAAGLRHFGENRVQDALAKFADDRPADLTLHLIGSVQTNKALQVVGNFDLIHSIDRVSLAEALQERAARQELVQPVLIQVNVAREEQKHGCAPEELESLIEKVLGLSNLRLRGLMTMAPFVATLEAARPVFVGLRELRDRMRTRFPEADLDELSMGMTNDFEVAVEEGATLVRVGRAIFAEPA
ncbi:MAG: YggS family pyridoxal phosphate-dependent enzyme [Chloroflexota bacterium]|nr:YggS family pyridoxal phosphate-dependent enzyme [Chloroflexota bacterium]